MIIYCSKKLETFIGETEVLPSLEYPSPLGEWNGDIFTMNRRKYLLLMNNKTCFSVVVPAFLKIKGSDLITIIKERVVEQLDHDVHLPESAEIKVRAMMRSILFHKTNNDKKIVTSINHHISSLKSNRPSDWLQIDNGETSMSTILNDQPMGTKIFSGMKGNRSYFYPAEQMNELVRQL